jgi:hypothetical protein
MDGKKEKGLLFVVWLLEGAREMLLVCLFFLPPLILEVLAISSHSFMFFLPAHSICLPFSVY